MKEETREFVVWLIIAILFITAVYGGAYLFIKRSCETQAKMMGLKCSYGLFEQCMIETKNGWIPLKNLREFN